MEDEKDQDLHTTFDEAEHVFISRRGRVRWPLWTTLLTCVPTCVALVVFGVLASATSSTVTGPLVLLHVRGQEADLWLGYSGACAQAHGSALTCRLNFLNSYYSTIYATVKLDTLEPYLPANLGLESSLLLAGLVASTLGVIFLIWGAIDYYRADEWHYEGRRGWVAEWLISRRLDLIGSAFVVAGTGLVVACAASTAIKVSNSAAAVNMLASKTSADFSAAKAGQGPTALFAACGVSAAAVLIEALVLAFDGLGHRIRSDYEDLVDDVQQLESETWVSVEAKMHTLAQLAARHKTAQALPDPQRRERARSALAEYLRACHVEDLLEEMQIKTDKHRRMIRDYMQQLHLVPPSEVSHAQYSAEQGTLDEMMTRLEQHRGRRTDGNMAETMGRAHPVSGVAKSLAPSFVRRSHDALEKPSPDENREAYYRMAREAEAELGDRDMPRGLNIKSDQPPPQSGLLINALMNQPRVDGLDRSALPDRHPRSVFGRAV